MWPTTNTFGTDDRQEVLSFFGLPLIFWKLVIDARYYDLFLNAITIPPIKAASRRHWPTSRNYAYNQPNRHTHCPHHWLRSNRQMHEVWRWGDFTLRCTLGFTLRIFTLRGDSCDCFLNRNFWKGGWYCFACAIISSLILRFYLLKCCLGWAWLLIHLISHAACLFHVVCGPAESWSTHPAVCRFSWHCWCCGESNLVLRVLPFSSEHVSE